MKLTHMVPSARFVPNTAACIIYLLYFINIRILRVVVWDSASRCPRQYQIHETHTDGRWYPARASSPTLRSALSMLLYFIIIIIIIIIYCNSYTHGTRTDKETGNQF